MTRTQISQTVSERTDQFWYIDSSNFSNASAHSDLLSRLQNEISRSDDDQIVSFRAQYSNPWPPCWMAVELSSMGNLSKMYKLLGSPNDRRTIASCYDLADPVMES